MLFNYRKIGAESYVVMVEGEIDAISIAIGTHHGLIVPVATGSTGGARWMRWIALLSVAKHVLVAFDSDEAGNEAAKWWLSKLSNARRLLPTRHDANSMLLHGDDMRAWIRSALK